MHFSSDSVRGQCPRENLQRGVSVMFENGSGREGRNLVWLDHPFVK